MCLNDGCRLMLRTGNSQKAFGVLISRLVEQHEGIQDVALRGTTFHGRGSAPGVRHRRLVDAAWRLFLGRISGLDGLIVRSRSSSVDEVIRTQQRQRPKARQQAHRSSLDGTRRRLGTRNGIGPSEMSQPKAGDPCRVSVTAKADTGNDARP
jgi:hypothetical protein